MNRTIFQPNKELAEFIIERSAKLKELLVFLEETCGYSRTSYDGFTKRANQKTRKKILILAALPEVIHITSFFLKSVGIPHETVGVSMSHQGLMDHSYRTHVAPTHHSEQISFDDDRDRHTCQSILDQCAIRRFIGSTSDKHASSNIDILIGDPQSLGNQDSGLCASSADYVVSLDEDWSGRGRNNIDGILMKNFLFYQGTSSNSRTRFIKLVLQNSFDQIFLAPQPIPNHRTTLDTQGMY